MILTNCQINLYIIFFLIILLITLYYSSINLKNIESFGIIEPNEPEEKVLTFSPARLSEKSKDFLDIEPELLGVVFISFIHFKLFSFNHTV